MNKNWVETLIFICFVIVAAALWYGHAMTSVRTEVVPIRVQYTGLDPHIAFIDSLPNEIKVEVRDAGQRIKTYYRDEPTITLNLHAQIENKEGVIDIPEEQLRNSVNNVLQGTSKLLTLNPATLRAAYYREEEKEVAVVLRSQISPAPEYQFIISPDVKEHTTVVYGESKVLQHLDTLYTELYTMSDLKDTLSDWVTLDLPSGVRTKEEKVELIAVTERFTEKVFTLPITYFVPDSSFTLRLFPSEASVTVRCAIHDFNRIVATDIVLYCNFPQQQETRLPIKARTSNPKIKLLRVNPSYAEYIVEQKQL